MGVTCANIHAHKAAGQVWSAFTKSHMQAVVEVILF